MDVSKYIAEFLIAKDHVLLPGLGSFISTYKPAQFDEQGKTLFPPKRIYSFDPGKKEGNDSLSRYIAGRENTPLSIAVKEVDEYVEGCHYVISKGKRLEIPGVGLLFPNESGVISFEQDIDLVKEGDFYGLPEVNIKTLGKISSYSAARIIMTIFIVAVLVLAGFYTQMIGRVFKEKFGSTAISPADTSLVNMDTTRTAIIDTIAPEQEIQPTVDPKKETIIKDSLAGIEKHALPKENAVQQSPQYYIVAGCFRSAEGAAKTAQHLKSKGFNASVFGKSKQGLNMVCYDSFQHRADAKLYLKKILVETNPEAWLIKY